MLLIKLNRRLEIKHTLDMVREVLKVRVAQEVVQEIRSAHLDASAVVEDAAQLGMFAAPPVAPGLDVDDFLAASQGYAAEDAAFAQMDAAEAQAQPGVRRAAFRYGAPPHAGFACGMDRLTAILAGEENIREVIAFPKTQSGADPLTNAPTGIDEHHLTELGLRVLPPTD